MKLTLSPADRIGPPDRPTSGEGRWARVFVFGIVVPFTLAAVAASAWYVITGETPLDVAAGMFAPPRIEMTMPPRPGPEKPAGALIRPPAPNDTDVKVAMQPGATSAEPQPAAPPPASPATEAPASPPPAEAAKPASADKGGLPIVNLPATPAATPPKVENAALRVPPPPPALSEPVIPPGGEPLAAPSFSQLPNRDDLKPLPAAPLPELLRNSGYGPLPITAGGKQPWKAYARPLADEVKQPRVAVVVTGLGLSKDATTAAIAKLPPEVSLSFSPYAANLDSWIKKARGSGHEVLLDLPLEPPNFPLHDAGPMAVLAQNSPAEAVDRLEAILGKATGYVGVAAALRSPVAASEQWGPLLRDLKNRGLLFLGDGLVGVADGNIPTAASVTLVADETPFRVAVDSRLTRLQMAAERDGIALAYVSARPVTLERLLAWFAALPQKGIALVPASAIVKPQP